MVLFYRRAFSSTRSKASTEKIVCDYMRYPKDVLK